MSVAPLSMDCTGEEASRSSSKIARVAVGASSASLLGVSLLGCGLSFSASVRQPLAGQRLTITGAIPRFSGNQGLPSAPSRAGLGESARLAFAAGAAALAGASAATSRRGRGGVAAVARRARGGADYYEVLGVPRTSTEKEIKTSFRKLARQWHPDVNKEPGAQEKFQSIAKAYEVLSDAQKRQRYDQFGEEGVRGMGGQSQDMSGMNLDDILGDVFSQFFGGGMGGGMGGMGGMGGRQRQQQQQQRGPAKGSDLQCDVEFPFATACFGGDVPVSIRREEPCSTCDGKGIKKDATSSSCRQCGGQGVVLQVMQTPLGVMQTQQVCPACQGSAIDPSCLCGSCRGKGTKPEVKEVSVKVPPGCDNGNQLRVRGEGDRGTRGGPAGDLYIAVKVVASREFQREGFDVYTESSVSAWDAMLGTQVVVKTIDGNAEIKVPGGTQPETRMRIRGRGVPKLGKPGERGDHYVTMKVDIPKSLSSEQAEKVKVLQAEMKK